MAQPIPSKRSVNGVEMVYLPVELQAEPRVCLPDILSVRAQVEIGKQQLPSGRSHFRTRTQVASPEVRGKARVIQ